MLLRLTSLLLLVYHQRAVVASSVSVFGQEISPKVGWTFSLLNGAHPVNTATQCGTIHTCNAHVCVPGVEICHMEKLLIVNVAGAPYT